MKLYTEEEIKRLLQKQIIFDENDIDKLTPIELLSDEEIEQEMNNEYPLTGHVGIDHRNYLRKVGYIQGAKWMRDKIKGGNK